MQASNADKVLIESVTVNQKTPQGSDACYNSTKVL